MHFREEVRVDIAIAGGIIEEKAAVFREMRF
jgi:hypothetical protein